MARIYGKDIYLDNDDQIYFGDNQEAALWYDADGEFHLNHTLSGVAATAGCHLITREQVEEFIYTATSGTHHRVYGIGDLAKEVPSKPATAILGPVVALLFDDNQEEPVYGTYVVQQDYQEGTNIRAAVIFMTDTSQVGTNTVRWQIDYHTYQEGTIYGSKVTSTKAVTSTLPNNCVAGYTVLVLFPQLLYNDSNNPLHKGTLVKFSLKRVPSADTMTGDAAFMAFAFFSEKERL